MRHYVSRDRLSECIAYYSSVKVPQSDLCGRTIYYILLSHVSPQALKIEDSRNFEVAIKRLQFPNHIQQPLLFLEHPFPLFCVKCCFSEGSSNSQLVPLLSCFRFWMEALSPTSRCAISKIDWGLSDDLVVADDPPLSRSSSTIVTVCGAKFATRCIHFESFGGSVVGQSTSQSFLGGKKRRCQYCIGRARFIDGFLLARIGFRRFKVG